MSKRSARSPPDQQHHHPLSTEHYAPMALVQDQDVVARGRSELSAVGAAASEYSIRVGATVHVANRHDLRAKIHTALDELGMKHIVLDASQTGFIDASGMGVIVGASKRAREMGGSLVIEGLSEDMLECLKLSHLDEILTLRSSADRAIGADSSSETAQPHRFAGTPT